eukprot:CAMPEP_0182846922 /NCGR_PEP_ID=MMETSP0006_2-20121128/28162_1 /TAXON_ID=97485 /ORGANISM="Prymnesium parvum, Strain Texoma1" /LENGTH=50 /DNA_ID=CAMNT_0024977179 /DNA_START=1 /DNA_END=154 /DNA_ORIENTATION=-
MRAVEGLSPGMFGGEEDNTGGPSTRGMDSRGHVAQSLAADNTCAQVPMIS